MKMKRYFLVYLTPGYGYPKVTGIVQVYTTDGNRPGVVELKRVVAEKYGVRTQDIEFSRIDEVSADDYFAAFSENKGSNEQ